MHSCSYARGQKKRKKKDYENIWQRNLLLIHSQFYLMQQLFPQGLQITSKSRTATSGNVRKGATHAAGENKKERRGSGGCEESAGAFERSLTQLRLSLLPTHPPSFFFFSHRKTGDGNELLVDSKPSVGQTSKLPRARAENKKN